LDFQEIIKIVAIIDVIFLSLKCAKFNFGCGSAPDPVGRAYSAPPAPYLDFRDSTCKGRDWKGKRRRDGNAVGK